MKQLLITLLSLCVFGCFSGGKHLNTLQDFKNKYKDLTYDELTKHDIGILPQKTREIALEQADFKKEHQLDYIDTIF